MLELNDLIRSLTASEAMITAEKQNMLNEVGQKMADKVKQNTPVDTGELRDSIHHEINNDSVSIVSDAEHAPYVDKGHVTKGGGTFVPGRHMFDKAMLQADTVIEAEAERFLNKINLLG